MNISKRQNGISAFMRIRNGADFLEPTIRSHIDHFDEIIAVYNQCTDATPDILGRLTQEYGTRLRVFHYIDRVFPPGSKDHAFTPADSPSSLVNYSNFALAKTRYRVVTKLDDDHFARSETLAKVVKNIRLNGIARHKILGFSGINLKLNVDKKLFVPLADPVSGSGDIGFFNIDNETRFTFDRRFENAPGRNLHRQFCGFLYWHLKYLKTGGGFANYELDTNPNSRFMRKQKRMNDYADGVGVSELSDILSPKITDQLLAVFSSKKRFIAQRNRALKQFKSVSTNAELQAIINMLPNTS
ncbi:hypothetical protein SU32_09960 [Ahrensia marina]|uniref:Glycosyltransferase 2-like domain-containing protein n=1 Tax=Ahrensia marina TaxID=1514904 RepID=A0A0M9GMY7_9HYPH|nr:hypothetical protein SU32_09960 [Ahrensia marina]